MAYDGGTWPTDRTGKTRKPRYRTPAPAKPSKPGRYIPPGPSRRFTNRDDDGKKNPFKRHFGPQPPGQPRDKRGRIVFGKKRPKPKRLPKRLVAHPLTLAAGGLGLPTDPISFLQWGAQKMWQPQKERPFSMTLPSPWQFIGACSLPELPAPNGYCDAPKYVSMASNNTAPSNQCLRGQAPTILGPVGTTLTPNGTTGRTARIWHKQGDLCSAPSPSSRYTNLETWWCPPPGPGAGGTANYKWKDERKARGPIPISDPIVFPDPAADPWSKPRPYQDPLPRPAPAPAPGTAPQPAPAPAPAPAPGPKPGIIVLPMPGYPQPWPIPPGAPLPGVQVPIPIPQPLPLPATAPPYVVPGTSIDVTPGPGIGAPSPAPAPPAVQPGHIRMPPPRGVKEVKLRSNAVTEVFKGLINLVTESSDAVNALFYAIDKNDRREGGAVGFMSPLDKASFVYSNLHLVNMREFMKNFFKNQAEDFVYGQLGRGSAWMQAQGGISTGFKDAALGHRGSVGKGGDGTGATNPAIDAINEFIDFVLPSDKGFNVAGRRATAARPVVKNWKRINKWTKRK